MTLYADWRCYAKCGANPISFNIIFSVSDVMMRRSTEIPRRESRFTNYGMRRINAQKFEKNSL